MSCMKNLYEDIREDVWNMIFENHSGSTTLNEILSMFDSVYDVSNVLSVLASMVSDGEILAWGYHLKNGVPCFTKDTCFDA
jgi:virulence-associated protein VapD